MSKASLLVDRLVARQPSPKELQERREAEGPHTKLIATTKGTFVDPAPVTTVAPSRGFQAPQGTTD